MLVFVLAHSLLAVSACAGPPPRTLPCGVPSDPVLAVEPVYPTFMLAAERHGKVYMELEVDATGAVRSVVVLKATHEEFALAAERAYISWIFQPPRAYCGSLGTTLRITHKFVVAPARDGPGCRALAGTHVTCVETVF
ncbi:MAG: energy transducer TonB [Myxococcota bacterium]